MMRGRDAPELVLAAPPSAVARSREHEQRMSRGASSRLATPGGGATFVIRLPAAPAAGTAAR